MTCTCEKVLKTTPENFESFKKYFNEHVIKLGLFGYRYYFQYKKLTDVYANTEYNVKQGIAVISFTTEWCCGHKPESEQCNFLLNEENIKTIAKHEVHHILLAKLYAHAEDRYTTKNMLETVEEEIVRVIDRFL
jgi:hypothetical protein